MPLINCEVILQLIWSANCVITYSTGAGIFAITHVKLHVPVVTLSTQDITKLLESLKSGFKRTIEWDKYQSKVSTQAQNHCFDYLIDANFQGVNRSFVLSF